MLPLTLTRFFHFIFLNIGSILSTQSSSKDPLALDPLELEIIPKKAPRTKYHREYQREYRAKQRRLKLAEHPMENCSELSRQNPSNQVNIYMENTYTDYTSIISIFKFKLRFVLCAKYCF